VAKAAGAEWGKMTDKVKWEKKAEEDKKRYEKDIAAYKEGTGAGKVVKKVAKK